MYHKKSFKIAYGFSEIKGRTLLELRLAEMLAWNIAANTKKSGTKMSWLIEYSFSLGKATKLYVTKQFECPKKCTQNDGVTYGSLCSRYRPLIDIGGWGYYERPMKCGIHSLERSVLGNETMLE